MDPDAVENLYLAVDNNVVIPVDVKIGLAVTSTDVIHS
jgi:heme/copper-type cytochrome/quinol oxidase subunit 2